MLLTASLSIYFIQWLIVHIISKEQQKVPFRQRVVKNLPKLGAGRKKKKMHKTSRMAQKAPWRWRKDLSAGERGWVSAGRVPSPRGDCCWWWVLLQARTSNPPWVTSWLLPAQATPGTPFSQQLGSLQGRGGGTLYFLGCRCARD